MTQNPAHGAPEIIPAAFRPFAFTAEEATQFEQELDVFIRAHLVPGVDFGVIPGTGSKPALLKTGAEKLCVFLGAAPTVDVIHRDIDWVKAVAAYEVKVTLIFKKTGVVIAEGIGCCNSKERKYKNQDAANVQNTILKMAKKRALVDATLCAVGSRFQAEEEAEIEEAPQRSRQPRYEAPREPQRQPQRQSQQPQQQRPEPARRGGPDQHGVMRCACGLEAREKQAASGKWFLVCGADPRVCDFMEPSSPPQTDPIEDSDPGNYYPPAPRQPQQPALVRDPDAELDAMSEKRAPVKFPIPRDARFQRCECGAEITFVQTKNGGQMPVTRTGESHFIDCPNAGNFRNRKPVGQPKEARPKAGAPKAESKVRPCIARLWALSHEKGLDCTDGARQGRIQATNNYFSKTSLPPVRSWSELTDARAQSLADGIERGFISWPAAGYSPDQMQLPASDGTSQNNNSQPAARAA